MSTSVCDVIKNQLQKCFEPLASTLQVNVFHYDRDTRIWQHIDSDLAPPFESVEELMETFEPKKWCLDDQHAVALWYEEELGDHPLFRHAVKSGEIDEFMLRTCNKPQKSALNSHWNTVGGFIEELGADARVISSIAGMGYERREPKGTIIFDQQVCRMRLPYTRSSHLNWNHTSQIC